MLSEIDNYFLQNKEPVKSYLLFLREFILNYDTNITEGWRYKMPFYFYKGKRFCYLWINKKTNQPYIGIVDGKKIEHPELITEKRSRMKIMLFNPDKNIPVKKIKILLKTVIALYT
ncbi:MAG: DUF1801 domain-containing protein [Bacteroidia bacterium]